MAQRAEFGGVPGAARRQYAVPSPVGEWAIGPRVVFVVGPGEALFAVPADGHGELVQPLAGVDAIAGVARAGRRLVTIAALEPGKPVFDRDREGVVTRVSVRDSRDPTATLGEGIDLRGKALGAWIAGTDLWVAVHARTSFFPEVRGSFSARWVNPRWVPSPPAASEELGPNVARRAEDGVLGWRVTDADETGNVLTCAELGGHAGASGETVTAVVHVDLRHPTDPPTATGFLSDGSTVAFAGDRLVSLDGAVDHTPSLVTYALRRGRPAEWRGSELVVDGERLVAVSLGRGHHPVTVAVYDRSGRELGRWMNGESDTTASTWGLSFDEKAGWLVLPFRGPGPTAGPSERTDRVGAWVFSTRGPGAPELRFQVEHAAVGLALDGTSERLVYAIHREIISSRIDGDTLWTRSQRGVARTDLSSGRTEPVGAFPLPR